MQRIVGLSSAITYESSEIFEQMKKHIDLLCNST